MTKRILSCFLCVCMIFTLALTAGAKEDVQPQDQAERYIITNRQSFLWLAEQCRLDTYSQDLLVVLESDLDLTGVKFEGIPVFCGTFDGNGHTIRGIDITASGSDQGFFRYLTETAVVLGLTLEGQVQPEGSRSKVGGLVGSNAGQIRNCVFRGTVSGNSSVGGLAGVNEVSGIIENCQMQGNVYGSHFIGGIAGENSGVIRNCENKAFVNETAKQNSVELTDITLESLTSTEAANTVTDIGGIAGISSGVIRSCYNLGTVGYPHMGYNIGGIAGTQSGMILDCENLGQVQGRKEVGGIVGQMEPTALIEYEEDALQILKRQLGNMGTTVSKTMSNLEGTTSQIVSQVGTLRSHVENAKAAVNTLVPDAENPGLPDLDTIQAAQNNIGSSISGMTQTLQGMDATAHTAMGAMSANLHTLQRQMDAMRTTLGNVSETLGGSLTDVSDRDTEADLSGKVANCVNRGAILADRNAGGIAGAMSLENDLDHEDDWTISGSNSLNFESELRAVVLACSNQAQVTVKKENAGGIVGWQPMGLVKNCLNSGDLDGSGANYVGGISGQSTGFIRGSSAKCTLSGGSYVGGIAGSASVATDCRSIVKLEHTGEKAGAILGTTTPDRSETQAPIAGNLYFSPFRDLGGIDGISYDGQAQPLDMEGFLALENLPEMFRSVVIRFRYPNGMERKFEVPFGGDFDERWTPILPPQKGAVASWEGYTEANLSEILFDMTFTSHYTRQTSVIGSENKRDGHPILLLQGSFYEEARLVLEKAEATAALDKEETLLEAWTIHLSGADSVAAGRLRIPEDCDGEKCRLLVKNADGVWNAAEHTVEGNSLVFALKPGDQGIALIQTADTPRLWIGMAGTLLVIAILAAYHVRGKRQK
ncbi:MAG: hypothetical protein IKA16_02400 [Oscillospiraceae bacterium]|nr:hypothetical protein [Oscillospiraceae bacterium]